MSESKVTTDREEIKRWVDARGGAPAQVKGTGVLRIDFPGFSGEESLERISWEEFFKAFDQNGLAFLYQEKTKDGKMSRFSKLIDRDTADQEKSRAASN